MRIKSIDMHGFKSFKKCHVEFSPHITAIIGPNGSGKSNIIDAIMFVLGESSLSKMRSDKLQGLINNRSTHATVVITLEEDGKEYRISREINKKGKGQAYIEGKAATLKEVKDFLFSKGMANIRSCIIPQGEILRIVKMKGKERKKYIDELADTLIYDIRRQEALKELEAVGSRIKEQNLILGEKLRLLAELEKEKELAERYAALQQELRNIRGTLISLELRQLKNSIESLESQKSRFEKELEEISAKEAEIDAKVEELEDERRRLDEKLVSVKEKEELFQKVESIKAEVKIAENEIESLKKQRDALDVDLEEMEKELEEKANRLEELRNEGGFEDTHIEEVEKLSEIEEELRKKKKELEEVASEIAELEKLREKAEALRKVNIGESRLEEGLEEKLEDIEKRMKEIMEDERRLSKEMSDIDGQVIKLREKLAVVKVGRSGGSPAHMLIEDLRKSGNVQGIYGKVIDLISFDPSLAEAIDAAAGGRLTYYVVDTSETARKVIEMLKKTKSGRATFLPLDSLRETKVVRGKHPLLIDMVEYNPIYEKAVAFVFGNTVLAGSFEEAKEISKNERVVTTSGELFEKSGAITGGKGKSSVALSKTADELSEKIGALKQRKSEILEELNALRGEVANLREERARVQAKIEEMKDKEEQRKMREEILAELKEIEGKLAGKDIEGLRAKKERLSAAINELSEKREGLEKEIREKMAEIASKKTKAQMIAQQVSELEIELQRLKEKKKAAIETKKGLDVKERALRDKKMIFTAQVTQMEESLKEKYKEIEGIMNRIRDIENELQLLGGERKSLQKEKESIEKTLHNVEISLATNKEKASQMESEISSFGSFESLEEPKHKLETRLREIERTISGMENINFAAAEAFERLNSEVGEVRDKIEKLKKEKDAVIGIINETDRRKKEAFLNAFNTLNEKFKEMFNYIEGFGKGELVLKNGDDPDKAELYIKVVQQGRDVYLDALAGGEKTLVSLFFLYALNTVKPSPFYIFDEVDAALDKLNCERYVEFLRNLTSKSQFIIISHRDPVISKADAIIGVSKSGGASKVVEIDLKKIAEAKIAKS